jgi:hypothetical protein
MFEPSVMCEPININDSFLSSQVCSINILFFSNRFSLAFQEF